MLNFELFTTNLSILKNRPLKILKTYKRKRFSVFFGANGLGISVIHVPAFPPSCVPEVSGTQAFRTIRARKSSLNLL